MRLPTAAESSKDISSGSNTNSNSNGDSSAKNQSHESQLNSNVREVDYSEYEWMEHIEEFDREVIRELEEQAFFEQCFMEASEISGGPIEYYCCDSDGLEEFYDEDEGFFTVVSARSNPQIFSSPLNPAAPEFVPKSFFKDKDVVED